MDSGATIKRLRKRHGLTQKQLAEAVGCTDAAIRNYESNARTLKGDALEKMASALDVEPSSLVDFGVDTAHDLLAVVFQAERVLGLVPVGTKLGLAVGMHPSSPGAPKVQAALEAWQRRREALLAGEITGDEYELWKAGFKL